MQPLVGTSTLGDLTILEVQRHLEELILKINCNPLEW
jgi:hypothetical protein